MMITMLKAIVSVGSTLFAEDRAVDLSDQRKVVRFALSSGLLSRTRTCHRGGSPYPHLLD